MNENIDNNIIDSLDDVNVSESSKINIREIFNSAKIDNAKLSSVIFDILNGDNLLSSNQGYTDFQIWHNHIIRDIENTYNELDGKYALEAMNLMLMHASIIGIFKVEEYNNWIEQFCRGGIL